MRTRSLSMLRISVCMIMAIALCAVPHLGFSTSRTWSGPTGGGAWVTATNWTPNGTPASGDDITIGGTSTMSFNNVGSVSLNSLTISNSSSSGVTLTNASASTLTIATLSVNGNLTTGQNVSLNITNGTVASGKQLAIGSLTTLTVNSTLTINGSGPCCANTPLTASGTVHVPSGGLINYTGSSVTAPSNITIDAGAELKFSGSGSIVTGFPTINGKLTLAGTTSTASGSGPSYGAGATLQYTGTSAQTANYYEFTNKPTDVVINNASGVNFNTSIPPNPVITGTLYLTSGTLKMGASSYPSITFEDGSTPIIKGSGNIDPGSTATIAFGASGHTGGSAFTLPSGLFTTANIYHFTLNRDNPITLNSQTYTNYFLTLDKGQLILGTGNFTTNSIGKSTACPCSYDVNTMVVTSASSGYLNYVFPAASDVNARTIPIGELTGGADYSPAIITMDTTSVIRTVGFRVVDASHPNLNNPSAPSDYITRYWNTTVTPTTGTYTYDLNLYYNGSTGDINGLESNMAPVAWNSSWVVYPGAVNTSQHYLGISGATETSAPLGYDFTGRTGAATLAPPTALAGTNAGCTQFTANWSASAGATAYFLDVSTKSDFSSFVSGYNNLNVGNVTTYNVTGLTAGQTYYYQLRATNGTLTSANSSTITYATLPLTPAVPTATAGTNAACTQFTANWNTASGATSYLLDVSTASNFSSFVSGYNNLNVGNVTNYTVSGLTSGQTYYYQVRATNACGTSANSGSITYATITTPGAPNFTSGTTALCVGGTDTYTATSTGATSVTYSVTGGATINPVTGVVSNVVSNFTVTAKGTNACGNVTTDKVVTVNALPIIAVSSNSPICSGNNLNLSANGGNSYHWSGPNAFTTNTTGAISTPTIVAATTAATGTYNVTVTDANNCVATGSTSVTVNATVVPVVSIAANPVGAFCQGTNVVFTPTASNTGNNPVYQWLVNGSNNGSGATFNSSNLNNGDTVRLVLTSTATCATPATVSSNTLTMVVNNTVSPLVTATAVPSGAVCTGANITFTATPQGGGNSPTYQWLVNGSNAATGSSFSSTTLHDGDSVKVIMSTNALCATKPTATSNTLGVQISGLVVPNLTISATPNGVACAGSSILFTPSPSGGGNTPTYQWLVDGNVVATGSTYTTNSLTNGAQVKAIMTSSLACATPTTATSNTLTITLSNPVAPSVTITSDRGTTACKGTLVTFTPKPNNGGATPTYQWLVNGQVVASGATYATSALNSGDSVTAIMTSNATCITTSTATSGSIKMTLDDDLVPSISITANPVGVICAGSNVTFTAAPVNGGNNPGIQWQVNGNNVSTGLTYSTTTLNNGDSVRAILTSTLTCISSNNAGSNWIKETVTASVKPTVSIAANPVGAICSGANVVFTPTPGGGGSNPTYQWYVNNNLSGSGATFSSSTLANGDQVQAILTSNATCASPATAQSNILTEVVTTPSTPTATITANPVGAICAGANVTFSASATFGGSPSYQWLLNGNPVAVGATYSTTALVDGDQVKAVMTSTATCVTTTTATSNVIIAIVNPLVTPSVSVLANPAGAVCAGSNVTFTAAPINGGTPTFQWLVNGNNVGSGTSFSSTTLNNGDSVKVIMTSNAACAVVNTVSSVATAISVNTSLTPSVTILPTPAGAICEGTSVTFTASPSGGGASPTYQWLLNGNNIAVGPVYTSTTLINGDQVKVVLTSSAACAVVATATSNVVSMTVGSSVTPSVNITSLPSGAVCAGSNVTFTAAPQNGGSPSLQWQVNGNNVGSGLTYTTSNLNNGDQVKVILTSNAACATTTVVTSNVQTMVVTQTVNPSVTIDNIPNGTICSGTDVVFTATPINGGTPTYLWLINGNNAGTGAVFTSNTLHNNDVVKVVMTSDLACVSNSSVTSNAIPIIVHTPVTPLVVQQGDTLLSTVANAYQWYQDTVLINGANDRKLGISHSGFYVVEITDGSGCKSRSALSLYVSTGIGDVANTPLLSIYPNPTYGTLHIDLANVTGSEPVSIRLYDAVGRMVINRNATINGAGYSDQLHLEDFATSIYLLQVKQGDWSTSHKVILTR